MVGVIDSGLGNFTYRAAAQGLGPGSPPFNNSWNNNLHYRAALSYITGSHVVKVGFNNAWGYFDNTAYTGPNPYFYTFNAGVPQAITIQAAPYTTKVEVDRDLGLFAQDRDGAADAGRSRAARPSRTASRAEPGADAFTPNRNVSFSMIENINPERRTPKLGATRDCPWRLWARQPEGHAQQALLGYGRSRGENGLSSDRIRSIVWSTRRGRGPTENANDRFRTATCRTSQNGECGAITDPTFGTITPGTTYDRTVDRLG
jgi:hypothetical protein